MGPAKHGDPVPARVRAATHHDNLHAIGHRSCGRPEALPAFGPRRFIAIRHRPRSSSVQSSSQTPVTVALLRLSVTVNDVDSEKQRATLLAGLFVSLVAELPGGLSNVSLDLPFPAAAHARAADARSTKPITGTTLASMPIGRPSHLASRNGARDQPTATPASSRPTTPHSAAPRDRGELAGEPLLPRAVHSPIGCRRAVASALSVSSSPKSLKPLPADLAPCRRGNDAATSRRRRHQDSVVTK
jgi:hypothetical protein